MKWCKRSFTAVSALLAVSLSLLSVDEPIPVVPLAPPVVEGSFVTAQASKRCLNICRARYHDCRSKGQVPPFVCENVYQDCTRWHCSQSGW
jgi:hypothetical protein